MEPRDLAVGEEEGEGGEAEWRGAGWHAERCAGGFEDAVEEDGEEGRDERKGACGEGRLEEDEDLPYEACGPAI